jgi:serine/threonine protein phosphatase 1
MALRERLLPGKRSRIPLAGIDAARSERQAPRLPNGLRVYAIGDVHGRADLLEALLLAIERDGRGRRPAQTLVVLLGDLIDRGPASSAVVEIASTWSRPWAELQAVRGNHETRLLALLEGEQVKLSSWLAIGGDETLMSYGFAPSEIKTWQTAAILEKAREVIPASHQKWLRSLPTHIRRGDYLFVHAGVRPGVPLDRQSAKDMLNIRSPFLESNEHHGAVVVHGHSIQPRLESRFNRIGIDTGAYCTGRLSAIGLEGAEQWFILEQGAASHP